MKTSSLTRAFFGALLATAAVPAVHAADGDPTEDTRKLDDRLRLYWGNEMREVEALQKRQYRKDQRFEFELYSGIIPNDEFYSYYPLGVRADYFFAEDFGAEVWGSYLIRVSSELEDFLESNFNQSLIVDVPQSLQWLAGANFLWSPIHGKLGIFTDKLAHFDVHLAFGVGVIGTTVKQLNDEKSKVDIAGNVGLGMRFFLSDSVALRFDYRQFFYPAEGGGLSHPAELTLGVSFFTSAPE
ncbi:MAG: outer membrane beta-barrel domain-containing protein [Deltaproteobacteria bacterium]|jgi:outer membrane beta-barrel protein|nr:outer membrane beta-barrel domain-containing protein [Deltaproteobacteria bacterium]